MTFLLLVFIPCFCGAQSIPESLCLEKEYHQKEALWTAKDTGATVLILLGTTCPICQKYTLVLNELSARYPSVRFVGVFTKWNSWNDIAAFRDSFHLSIALRKDAKHKLIRQLKATTTPEVFLFNAHRELVYRGAIDNWYYERGKYRTLVTENYLENTIRAQQAGAAPPLSQTRPIGCTIEQ